MASSESLSLVSSSATNSLSNIRSRLMTSFSGMSISACPAATGSRATMVSRGLSDPGSSIEVISTGCSAAPLRCVWRVCGEGEGGQCSQGHACNGYHSRRGTRGLGPETLRKGASDNQHAVAFPLSE